MVYAIRMCTSLRIHLYVRYFYIFKPVSQEQRSIHQTYSIEDSRCYMCSKVFTVECLYKTKLCQSVTSKGPSCHSKASWNSYTKMEKELRKTSTTKNFKNFRFCNIIIFKRKVKEVNSWHSQWICASYYFITDGLQRSAKCFWWHSLRSLNLQIVYTVYCMTFK